MQTALVRIGSFLLLLLFAIGCAKRGAPTGGPIDSIPPVLINASPKRNTIRFDKEKFVLTFNEYVTLNEVSKQLIVSPPMEKSRYSVYPQTGASRKVTIEFNDSLNPETTYTFNFGESIQDNNEGNILPYFTYTLSTGDEIDSLFLKGTVTDALRPKHPHMCPYSYTLLTAPITILPFTKTSRCMWLVHWILLHFVSKI